LKYKPALGSLMHPGAGEGYDLTDPE